MHTIPNARMMFAEKKGQERAVKVLLPLGSRLDFGFDLKHRGYLDGDRVKDGRIVAPDAVTISDEEDMTLSEAIYGRTFWAECNSVGSFDVTYVFETHAGRKDSRAIKVVVR